MVLVLITGLAPICGGNDNDDYLDLIAKIRDPDYFGVTIYEASDDELRIFLRDEPNRIFIEGTIRQITFGYKALEPSGGIGMPAEVYFLNFVGDKLTVGGLTLFLRELGTNYSPFGTLLAPIIGPLITIRQGVEVFKKFAGALTEFNQRNIMFFYVHERKGGKSAEEAYNLTIDDPAFEPVVNLVLSLEELITFGKTRAELKENFWDYSEYTYQSWDLANSSEKKENIKRYILEWIERNTLIPTQTPTFTLSPIPPSTPTIIACPPEGEPKFSPGEEVITTDSLRVRTNPGLTPPEIKTEPERTSGKILEGPVCTDNYTWWKVEYQDGTIGWSAEDWLVLRDIFRKQIAYINPSDGDLYLVHRDGTNPKKLTENRDIQWFAWLPNGKAVLYDHYDGHSVSKTILIDIDTGEEQEILRGRSFIRLSPNSKEFLYWEGNLPNHTLAIFDLESRLSRSLPIQQTHRKLELGVSLGITSLVWSPDGKKIAYIDNHFVDLQTGSRGKAIWIMSVDTFEKKIIWEATAGAVGKPISLNWSLDGRKIGFATTLVRQGLGLLAYELLDIDSKSFQTILNIPYEPRRCGGVLSKLMDVHWTTENAKVILSFPEDCWRITSSIFEVEPELSSPGIWLFEKRKEPKRLSELSSFVFGNAIDISSDGTFLVFVNESQLYTINIDGTNLIKVAELGLRPMIAP